MDDIPDKITGNKLTADEWNNVPDEIENIIESAGITLSGADRFQLAKAVSQYVASGSFYSDGGSANNYVLSTLSAFKAPIEYSPGMKVRFIAANANTTTSTVNVDGIGVIAIKKDEAATPLGGGEIKLAAVIELTYRTSPSTYFELTSVKLATEVHPGIIQIATQAEMITGTNQTKAGVPGHITNASQKNSWKYRGTTGTATAYDITTLPSFLPQDGSVIWADIHITNTGAATLNANGQGALPIVTSQLQALIGGEILATHRYIFINVNNTVWAILSQHATATKILMEAAATNNFMVTPANAIWHRGVSVLRLLWNQTGDASISVLDSWNVSSVNVLGRGTIGINFNITMANTTYSGAGVGGGSTSIIHMIPTTRTVNNVEVEVIDHTDATTNKNGQSFEIFGELA